MAKLSRARLIAYTALALNTLLWGLALPIVKKGFAAGLSPTTFLLTRFYIASLLSLPIIFYLRRRLDVQRTFRFLLPVIAIELIGNVLSLLLLYEGVDRTSAVESSLIASAWPIFAIIGSVLFLKEKEQKHEVAGLLLALAGTALLVGRPLLANHLNGSSLLGNLLILGQNLTNAAYVLLAKKFYHRLNLWAVTAVSFWTSAASFTALSLYQGHSPVSEIFSLTLFSNPYPLISVLYMAIFGSILGLTLYLIGQSKIEASEATLFTYLQPAIALPASVLLLSESIHPLEILGLVTVLLGVYLAEKR